MKRLLVFFLLLASLPVYSQQARNVYRYKQFQDMLHYLDHNHYKVRKLKKKFNVLMKHSEIVDAVRARTSSSRYYDDFFKEWTQFIQHLKGRKREQFMKYAENQGMGSGGGSVF